MKKTQQPAGRYIIEMYRAYEAAGQPDKKEIIKQLEHLKPEQKNEKACLMDLLAIADVMQRLEEEGRTDVKEVVQDTYMSLNNEWHRGAITDAVKRVTIKYYMGEATVYRLLKIARVMAAEERGLRIY